MSGNMAQYQEFPSYAMIERGSRNLGVNINRLVKIGKVLKTVYNTLFVLE